MDSTTVLTGVGGLLVLSVIILTSLCLYCKGSSQPKQITQTFVDQHNNQVNQGRFVIIRSYTENSICTNTLSPVDQPHFITSPSVRDTMHLSPGASPDGSQSDYVNEEDENGYEQPPDKNNDYLDVLPNETHVSQHSLGSSANSGQNYENIGNENDSVMISQTGSIGEIHDYDDDDDDNDSDSQHYINISDGNSQIQIGSYGSYSSDGPDTSDYVNAPNQVCIHLG